MADLLGGLYFTLTPWLRTICGALLCLCVPLTTRAQVIEIPDPELQLAIRRSLQKPTGEITTADMASLTNLDASHYTRRSNRTNAQVITSLEGLQFATNLTHLDISGWWFWSAQIGTPTRFKGIDLTDLRALQALPNLTFLNSGYNQLSNTFFPPALTNISTLKLNNNDLTEVDLASF